MPGDRVGLNTNNNYVHIGKIFGKYWLIGFSRKPVLILLAVNVASPASVILKAVFKNSGRREKCQMVTMPFTSVECGRK